MVEVYLIVTGIIFFAWLYALVRQTQRGYAANQPASLRPVVPVNLFEGDDAVVVAEGRGRIIYANDSARQWFGIDGGAPNLALMSQRIYPRDTLHDLVAGSGHATFRLGQRQIEAVSHRSPARRASGWSSSCARCPRARCPRIRRSIPCAPWRSCPRSAIRSASRLTSTRCSIPFCAAWTPRSRMTAPRSRCGMRRRAPSARRRAARCARPPAP